MDRTCRTAVESNDKTNSYGYGGIYPNLDIITWLCWDRSRHRVLGFEARLYRIYSSEKRYIRFLECN